MSGNAALGILVLGGALIAVECNRPGRVVPGAAGLLLALWGTTQLALVSGGHSWMGIALIGLATLLLLWWRPFRGVPGVVGTMLLLFAMHTAAAASAGRISAWWAMLCGLVLGAAASLLLYAAGRARRAKQTGHQMRLQTTGNAAGTGVPEYWGVD